MDHPAPAMESGINEVRDDFNGATSNMDEVMEHLQECFVEDNSRGDVKKDFRVHSNNVTQNIVVYEDLDVPLTLRVVSDLNERVDFFHSLANEEMKDNNEDLRSAVSSIDTVELRVTVIENSTAPTSWKLSDVIIDTPTNDDLLRGADKAVLSQRSDERAVREIALEDVTVPAIVSIQPEMSRALLESESTLSVATKSCDVTISTRETSAKSKGAAIVTDYATTVVIGSAGRGSRYSSQVLDSRINDNCLRDAAQSLSDLASSLLVVMSCIQSCYSIQASPNQSFRKMRGQVSQAIVLFRDLYLYQSSQVVSDLKQIFSYYGDLDEDTFKDCIKDIAQDVSERAENAKKLTQMNGFLLDDLNGQQKQALGIIDSLYHEHESGMLQAKAYTNIGLQPAVDLRIADLELQACACRRRAMPACKAVAEEEQALLALSASKMIEGELLPALRRFTEAVGQVNGFFSTVEKEFVRLAEGTDNPSPNHLQWISLHFTKMQKGGTQITQACDKYIACETIALAKIGGLAEQLKQGTDNEANYIQRWFDEKQHQADQVTEKSMKAISPVKGLGVGYGHGVIAHYK